MQLYRFRLLLISVEGCHAVKRWNLELPVESRDKQGLGNISQEMCNVYIGSKFYVGKTDVCRETFRSF